MADDEQSTSGTFAGLIEEYFSKLRGVTEGLQNLAGSGAQLQPAPVGLPLPGALSAAQLASIANSIAAQRRSIEALKAQLSSFDEQLPRRWSRSSAPWRSGAACGQSLNNGC